MPPRRSRARAVLLATRLLFVDLARRRVTLLLLFIVPALFDAVVLVTTGHHAVDVVIATLGAGVHALDDQKLSLVFLGHAAVCFLVCFLSFYLVCRRREVDARLVLCGYHPWQVLLAKLFVLMALSVALAVYETVAIVPFVTPAHTLQVGAGFFLGGLVYGCIGLLIGAVTKQELEGIFLIVLITNIDVGWLQNPTYYAASERRAVIEAMPGFYPAQLAVTGAFTDQVAPGAVVRSLAIAAVVLLVALAAFGVRIRRPGSGGRDGS